MRFRVQKYYNSWCGWRRFFGYSRQLRNMSDCFYWIIKNIRILKITDYSASKANLLVLAHVSPHCLLHRSRILPGSTSVLHEFAALVGVQKRTQGILLLGRREPSWSVILFNPMAELSQTYSSTFITINKRRSGSPFWYLRDSSNL